MSVRTDIDKANLQEVPKVHLQTQLVAITFVFFLSGFSSLLYQVAWQRLLTVHYGVGATSVTLIVSIYMLGLGLGALLGGRLSRLHRQHILPIYCSMEGLLGLFGILSIPILQSLGIATSGLPASAYLISIFSFLFLPTLLMGTTLPLLTEHLISKARSFADTVSRLYFVNTLGASCGAIAGAYLLISFFGLDAAIYTAAFINFIIALTVTKLKAGTNQLELDSKEETLPVSPANCNKGIRLWVFISGLVAIALEIVWFRTIEIIVKASPYAFASTLGIYLFGIGLGSWFLNRLLNKNKELNTEKLFLVFQLIIAGYVYLSFLLLSTHAVGRLVKLSNLQELHPNFTTIIFTAPSEFAGGWFTYLDIVLWPLFFLFVPTVLMGASFPLVSAMMYKRFTHGGEAIAATYFINVLGNVLGGIMTGFLLLHFLGTANTVLVLCALLVSTFVPPLLKHIETTRARVVLSLGIALPLLFLGRYPSNEKLFAGLHSRPEGESNAYVQEGADCVDVAFEKDGTVWHYINGMLHGGRMPHISGYYRRAAEGLSHAKIRKSVLVIGYGTGAIAELVAQSEEVSKITIVELNESVMINLKKMPLFQNLLRDRRIHLVIDDGRRYLNRTQEGFDVILMDPLRSTTAYSNNIYSREFFQLVRTRLNHGGVLMVWLDEFRILPKTVCSVFKHVLLHTSFCLASDSEMRADYEFTTEILKNFSESEKQRILTSQEHFTGDKAFIERTCSQAPINTDLHPYSEYHLGLVVRDNR